MSRRAVFLKLRHEAPLLDPRHPILSFHLSLHSTWTFSVAGIAPRVLDDPVAQLVLLVQANGAREGH